MFIQYYYIILAFEAPQGGEEAGSAEVLRGRRLHAHREQLPLHRINGGLADQASGRNAPEAVLDHRRDLDGAVPHRAPPAPDGREEDVLPQGQQELSLEHVRPDHRRLLRRRRDLLPRHRLYYIILCHIIRYYITWCYIVIPL